MMLIALRSCASYHAEHKLRPAQAVLRARVKLFFSARDYVLWFSQFTEHANSADRFAHKIFGALV